MKLPEEKLSQGLVEFLLVLLEEREPVRFRNQLVTDRVLAKLQKLEEYTVCPGSSDPT